MTTFTASAEVHPIPDSLPPLPSGEPPAMPPLSPAESVLSEGEIVDDNNNEEEGEKKESDLYKERVRKVREMLALPQIQPQASKDVCMSVETDRARVKHILPASKNFSSMFSNFLDEVKGVSKKKGSPMDVGTFPKRFQPRMTNYELEDCPWSVEAVVNDPELYNSSLWRHKDNPQFRISQKKIAEWETSNREGLSVASYTDSFLWSVKSMLTNMRDNLDSRRFCEDPTLTLDHIMELRDQTTEALQFLQSAARGIQDMTKLTVGRIGSQVLSRRDNCCNALKGNYCFFFTIKTFWGRFEFIRQCSRN
jgi:hypothetical protein